MLAAPTSLYVKFGKQKLLHGPHSQLHLKPYLKDLLGRHKAHKENHCVCASRMHLLSARPSQRAGEVPAAEWGKAGICLGWLEKGGFKEPVGDAGCLPPPQSFSPKCPPTQRGSNSANTWGLSPAAPMGVISCDPLLLVTPLLILPSSVNTHPATHPRFPFLVSSSKLKSLIRKD